MSQEGATDSLLKKQNTSTAVNNETGEPKDVVLTLKERIAAFISERLKSIIFRCFSLLALTVDVLTIVKKNNRGHTIWVIISVALLLFSLMAGALYSVWCHLHEKYISDPPPKDYFSIKYKKRKKVPLDISKGFRDETVDIMLEAQNYIDEEDANLSVTISNPSDGKSTGNIIEPDGGNKIAKPKTKSKKHGTYMEPSYMDPKHIEQDGPDDISEEDDEDKPPSQPAMTCQDITYLCCKTSMIPMVISHLLLFSKEYRFLETSQKLWQHLNEPYNRSAVKEMSKKKVKKVCYSKSWNDYCYSEIMSKQLSLIIATTQNIPMTIMDMLYWSLQSKNISELKDRSDKFLSLDFTGEQFNIVELISILLNLLKVSYYLVSLVNQARKLDFSRQDLVYLHLIYLMSVHFLLLIARVSSFFLVMSISSSGVSLGIALLVIQFSLFFIVSLDLQKTNNITLFISSILMLFIYVPPKTKNRISFHSYQMLMALEMIGMFVFGYIDIRGTGSAITSTSCIINSTSNSTINEIYLFGHGMEVKYYYYGYVIAASLFILGSIMQNRFMQMNLFRVYHRSVKRDDIKDALRDVNDEHDTEYKILTGVTGRYGQDKDSFSNNHTIYLF